MARLLDDGQTLEIIRVCTDGTPQACSMLYGALCRAGKALGYTRAVTYTLGTEPGTSLRAAGFVKSSNTNGGRDWARAARPRYEEDLFGSRRIECQERVRWDRLLASAVSQGKDEE